MAYIDKAPQYGLIAVAFTLPFVILNHISEYVFLSLLMIWVGRKLFTNSLVFEKTSLDLPILLFLGWVLLTVPFATDWTYSLVEWRKSLPRFLMFWFVVQVVQTEQNVRAILHSLSIGLVLLALLESSHFFAQGGEAFSMTMRAGEFTGSSQWLSCFLVIGIPILCLGFFCTDRFWIRILYLSGLVMSGFALFLVHTRAAWVAVVIQALFYGVLRVTKSWFVSGLVTFLSVSVFIVFLALPGPYLEMISGSEFTSPDSMVKRFHTWDIALYDIRDHPVTGIGYGQHSFHLKHPDLGGGFHTHIHNYFLSSTVQIGIPGFLFIAWIFWIIFHKTFTWSKRFSDQYLGKLALAMFLITLGLGVRILFDDMLIGTVVYLFMLLLGVCFSLGVQIQDRTKTKTIAEGY